MSRRPILSLWRSREDDARRTKGDPPPTYAQLEATAAALTSTLKTQGELLRNLRSQADGLNKENRNLRTALAERTDDVGTMAAELAEIKAGGICGDEAPALSRARPAAVCNLPHGHASEWHQGEGGHRWKNIEPSAEPKPTLREERIYDLGYLSLPADVQQSLERDWAERHLGPGGER